MKIYALYKGDEFITLGTKDEISKETGIGKPSLNRYQTPSYKKENEGKNCYILIKIEDDNK